MSKTKRPWPFEVEQAGQEQEVSKRIEIQTAESDWNHDFDQESTGGQTLAPYDHIPVQNGGSTWVQSWHDLPEEEICFGSV